jgi:hypothetical protein
MLCSTTTLDSVYDEPTERNTFTLGEVAQTAAEHRSTLADEEDAGSPDPDQVLGGTEGIKPLFSYYGFAHLVSSFMGCLSGVIDNRIFHSGVPSAIPKTTAACEALVFLEPSR